LHQAKLTDAMQLLVVVSLLSQLNSQRIWSDWNWQMILMICTVMIGQWRGQRQIMVTISQLMVTWHSRQPRW